MDLSPELLLRYASSGPRYTSYPPAPLWSADFPQADFDAALARARAPVAVYVHIPFCARQCLFCGCNMVVAGRREPGDRYLDALERQTRGLPLASERLPVVRIHLGGGTPTWYAPRELERLYGILLERFAPSPGAELSVEADPAWLTDEQIDTLAGLGVNRLSLGVQSFDDAVLAAVNRPQQAARIAEILERARRLGMRSLNLDLMYGLPHQTAERWAADLDTIIALRPDRLAVFGYAHVPWLRDYQKRLDGPDLPGPVDRAALFLAAQARLSDAGYQSIGFDHFALPDDDLATAQRAGALHRNFMGFTTLPDVSLIGLGMSAISELDGVYVQARSKLAAWWRAIEDGEPLIEKGYALTEDDRLRRAVIYGLLCNFTVRYAEIEARFGIDFEARFGEPLAALAPLEDDGLVERHADRLQVTPRGRLLVRNVAMVFDAGLSRGDRPRYSQTV